MLAQQVLLHLQHPRVVVAAHLHGRLAHLLLRRRQRAPVHQQHLLVRPQQQLARQGQPGQPAADDQHVHVLPDALHGLRLDALAALRLLELAHASFSRVMTVSAKLSVVSLPPPAGDSGGEGLLRPYISCAATNSPLASAAPIESSPASRVAAAISASFGAPPAPAQPSISRHSRAVPPPVPPPTVATVSDGSVTLAWRSPSAVTSKCVTPTAELTTLATSWPQAMNSAARPLAKWPL